MDIKKLPLYSFYLIILSGALLFLKLNINKVLPFFYIILILSLGVLIVSNFIAAIMLITNQFRNYWLSSYPISLILFFLGYSFLETSCHFKGIIAIIVGFVLGVTLKKFFNFYFLKRFLPFLMLISLFIFSRFNITYQIFNNEIYFEIIYPLMLSLFSGILSMLSYFGDNSND